MKILLGSGGIRTPERRKMYLHLMNENFDKCKKVIFIPYAGNDYDEYTNNVREMFRESHKCFDVNSICHDSHHRTTGQMQNASASGVFFCVCACICVCFCVCGRGCGCVWALFLCLRLRLWTQLQIPLDRAVRLDLTVRVHDDDDDDGQRRHRRRRRGRTTGDDAESAEA